MSKQPNILFIMSDDHAAHAMSCYGSTINQTPNLDRIANEGVRLDSCFCTNAICAPSRATILTGLYSHMNGVLTLDQDLDNNLSNFAKLLKADGYQTAIVGKWHLGHDTAHQPRGFDFWRILPGQGAYHAPVFIDANGEQQYDGYVTDLITDFSLDWLENRDPDQPFCLLTHHKAPHRHWEPDDKHADMYADIDIPEPPTFNDDYSNRAAAAAAAKMRIDRDMIFEDYKVTPPEDLTPEQEKSWKYQRYIKDYLRVVASIDDNVGRMLDYLDEHNLTDDTIVIYTSDQGFFLGDHGWYDKRFMYEESLQMPFVMRYPREIPAGSTNNDIINNVDFAPLFLDYAGVTIPNSYQGRSFRANVQGNTPDDWRDGLYYRYWMHKATHNVYAHYGLRTERYKLIYYYADGLGITGTLEPAYEPEWELFDLAQDPQEMYNVYHDPAYQTLIPGLKAHLHRLQAEVGDERYPLDTD